MTVDRFVADRSDAWTELDALLREARSRPERLGPARLRRLGALYRAAAADLATARRRWPSEPEVGRLEDLVGRGRLAVYGRSTRRGSAWTFISRRYWQRVAERPALLLIAALLLFVPTALTTIWGLDDPVAASQLVPGKIGTVSEPGPEGNDLGLANDEQASLSAEIMTNNIQVTFYALVGGITAGLATAFVLVTNGALLGAVAGIMFGGGAGSPFVELIVPHGVLELSCIVVGGAAGLRIGAALIDPGDRRRTLALVDATRAATEIALGTALWLVVAGLVEGFVTPRGIGVVPALGVGLGLGGIYWALVVRRGLRGGPVPSA